MSPRQLRILEPDKSPRDIVLQAGVTIGRQKTDLCSLDDPSVSWEHARIVEREGRLAIQDLGSSNKTRIEGGPTLSKDQEALIVPGMCIHVGKTKLLVLGEANEELATEPRRETPVESNTVMRRGPAREADEMAV